MLLEIGRVLETVMWRGITSMDVEILSTSYLVWRYLRLKSKMKYLYIRYIRFPNIRSCFLSVAENEFAAFLLIQFLSI